MRAILLQVVSEKLSQHVIKNYDKFVAGVNEVSQVEHDLHAAHITTKQAREALALALREVGAGCAAGPQARRPAGTTHGCMHAIA